jgi:hypothetical protein
VHVRGFRCPGYARPRGVGDGTAHGHQARPSGTRGPVILLEYAVAVEVGLDGVVPSAASCTLASSAVHLPPIRLHSEDCCRVSVSKPLELATTVSVGDVAAITSTGLPVRWACVRASAAAGAPAAKAVHGTASATTPDGMVRTTVSTPAAHHGLRAVASVIEVGQSAEAGSAPLRGVERDSGRKA